MTGWGSEALGAVIISAGANEEVTMLEEELLLKLGLDALASRESIFSAMVLTRAVSGTPLLRSLE